MENKLLIVLGVVALVALGLVTESSSYSSASSANKQNMANMADSCSALNITAGGTCSPSSTNRCTSGTTPRGRLIACEYYCNSSGVIANPTECSSGFCNNQNTGCLLGTEEFSLNQNPWIGHNPI